jgi:hypothetical protein
MLSAGLVAAFLANAGFAAAEQARAAVIVAVPEGGSRVVAQGAEVVIDLFLELEPDERVKSVRLEMDVSNLRDVKYRQVPDLMLGALPNAPWQVARSGIRWTPPSSPSFGRWAWSGNPTKFPWGGSREWPPGPGK